MAKKVLYAKLHSTFFIPSLGNMKDTLPSDSKTLQDFEMVKEDDGSLTLSWSVRVGSNKVRRSYGIGAASVLGVSYEDEIVTEKKAE